MTIRLLMYRLKNIIPRERANQEPKSGFSCQVIYFSMFLETSISRLLPESIHSFGISFVVFCLLVLSFVLLVLRHLRSGTWREMPKLTQSKIRT